MGSPAAVTKGPGHVGRSTTSLDTAFEQSPSGPEYVAMIHVLVVDDHPVVRAGFSHFIDKRKEIIVSSEATPGAMDYVAKDAEPEILNSRTAVGFVDPQLVDTLVFAPRIQRSVPQRNCCPSGNFSYCKCSRTAKRVNDLADAFAISS